MRTGHNAIATLAYQFENNDIQFTNFPSVTFTVPKVLAPSSPTALELFQDEQAQPFYLQVASKIEEPGGSYQYTFSPAPTISWVGDSSSTYSLELVTTSDFAANELPSASCPNQTVSGGTESSVTQSLSGFESLCVPSYWTFGGAVAFPFATYSTNPTITATSSIANIMKQPKLGPSGESPLYYLGFSIASPIDFGTGGSAGGNDGLTAANSPEGIIPGHYYSAYGQITLAGTSVELPPCYESAVRGPYGRGWLHGIGSLLYGVNVTTTASGVIEIYSDAVVPSGQAKCPNFPVAVPTPTPSPSPSPT
jgi:hypothetical protein